MGRPERPIEETAGELGRFAADLRRLRTDAGLPTYQAMARRGDASKSALAEAAAGRRLPRWRTVEQYVRACDGEVSYWRERWEAVQVDDDGLAVAPDEATELPQPAGTRGTTRRRRSSATIATIASVVLLILVGGVMWLASAFERDGALLSETEQPIFTEDFDGGQLNLQRWVAPSDPMHLFPRGNVLNLIGSTEPGKGVNVDLAAQDLGPFREIDFVIGTPEYPSPGSGGGSLVLTEQSGRTQKLVFGPSPGPVPLSVTLLACARPTCTRYDDYEPPAPPVEAQMYRREDAVPIKVVQNDSVLTIWMRGVVIGQAPVTEPLGGFTFNGYAEPGERWRITVDAVRVYR